MKPFPENTNYLVSRDGQIYSLISEKYMKPKYSGGGYQQVKLQGKYYLIHRVVAITYIDNPNQYPQVNHIDMNKHNNDVCNLEWCTSSQNHCHGRKNKPNWKLPIGRSFKTYVLMEVSTGNTFTVKNLANWCRDNNKNPASMCRTSPKYNNREGNLHQSGGFRVISIL